MPESVQLKIDIRAFVEGLKGALSAVREFRSQADAILSGGKGPNLKAFDDIVDNVKKNISELKTGLSGAHEETDLIVADVNKLSKPHHIPVEVDKRPALESLSNIGNAITGLVHGLYLVRTLFGWVNTALLQASADFEQLRTRITNMYQSTEKASRIFDLFKKTAATTPFQLREIMEAGATIKAFGMDVEEMLKPISDLAAFMGVDVVEAAASVGRAFAGGVSAADILRERGILVLIKDFKKIDDLTKISLPAFRKAMFETLKDPASEIAGATDKMSKTFTGSVSNMKDALTNLSANIGNYFTPALATGIRALTRFIDAMAPSKLSQVKKETSQTALQFEALTRTLSDLGDVTKGTALQKEQFRTVLASLNDQYGSYVGNLDLTITRYRDLVDVIGKARNKLLEEAATKRILAGRDDLFDAIVKLKERVIEYKVQVAKAENIVDRLRKKSNDGSNDSAIFSYQKGIERVRRNIAEAEKEISDKFRKISDIEEHYKNVINGFSTPAIKPPLQNDFDTPEYKTALDKYYDTMKWLASDYESYMLSKFKAEKKAFIDATGDKAKANKQYNESVKLLEKEKADWLISNNASKKEKETEFYEFMKWKSADYESFMKSKYDAEKADFIKKTGDKTKAEALYTERIMALENEKTEYLKQLETKRLSEERQSYETRKKYLENEMDRLENWKTLGLNVAGDLRRTWEDYYGLLKQKYESSEKQYFEAESGKVTISAEALAKMRDLYTEDKDAYLSALDKKKQADLKYFDEMRDNWKENHKVTVSVFDSILEGFTTMWDVMIKKGMTGAEKWNAAWMSLSTSFYRAMGKMLTDFIEKKTYELLIHKSVEAQKTAATISGEAVRSGAHKTSVLGQIALDIWAGMKFVALKMYETMAALVKFYSFLGPFAGPAAVVTMAGLADLISRFKNFWSGGYTGPGGKYEPKGVVHGKEFVFDQESTDGNVPYLYALMGVLRKGVKLKDIFGAMQIPSYRIQPQLSYATGGFVASSSLSFDSIIRAIADLGDRIQGVQIHIHNHIDPLSGKSRQLYDIVETGRKKTKRLS